MILTIIIPVFNEKNTIKEIIRKINLQKKILKSKLYWLMMVQMMALQR